MVNAYVLLLNDMSIVSINDPLAYLEIKKELQLYTAVHEQSLIRLLLVLVVLLFTFSPLLHICILPSLLKSKFKWTINRRLEASIFTFKAETLFT